MSAQTALRISSSISIEMFGSPSRPIPGPGMLRYFLIRRNFPRPANVAFIVLCPFVTGTWVGPIRALCTVKHGAQIHLGHDACSERHLFTAMVNLHDRRIVGAEWSDESPF